MTALHNRAGLHFAAALVAAGVVALAPNQSHAAQDPRPGRYDARVRTVVYNPMNPVRLMGTTFTSTQVIFAPGETITHVAIGDSEAWLPQPAGNLLFIKPVEVRAPTNMQVVTTRPGGALRSYQFELVARAAPLAALANPTNAGAAPTPAAVFAIQFVYPEDDRLERSANRQRAAATADQRLAEDRLVTSRLTGPRNWHYAAQGSRATEPAEISDDGRLTAMRFPDNTPLPAIYAVAADGQETILPFTMQGGTAVLATTAREFRLRAGGDVTRVLNLAYDTSQKADPGTGTTSQDVLRRIQGAQP